MAKISIDGKGASVEMLNRLFAGATDFLVDMQRRGLEEMVEVVTIRYDENGRTLGKVVLLEKTSCVSNATERLECGFEVSRSSVSHEGIREAIIVGISKASQNKLGALEQRCRKLRQVRVVANQVLGFGVPDPEGIPLILKNDARIFRRTLPGSLMMHSTGEIIERGSEIMLREFPHKTMVFDHGYREVVVLVDKKEAFLLKSEVES